MKHDERRSYPRLRDEALGVRLSFDESCLVTHTVNISASGIYCKVGKEIPLMSRLKLLLMLPGDTDAQSEKSGMEINGVVVREHPVIIDGEVKHYDVAIFFEDLSPKTREIILSYIKRRNKPAV